jgi:hypothetical protein
MGHPSTSRRHLLFRRAEAPASDDVLPMSKGAATDLAHNLQQASLGLVDVVDLGPGYYRAEDGTLGIRLDAEASKRFEAAFNADEMDS